MTASVAPVAPTRRRWTKHPLWHSLLGLLATVLPIAFALALSEAVAPKAWRLAWPQLLAAALSVAGYCWYVRRIERRAVTELARAGALRGLSAGAALGAALAAASVGLLAVAGVLHVDGGNAWPAAFKPLPEMVLVALFEELLCRGILFRKTEEAWGSGVALAVTAAFFVLAHLPGEGFGAMAAIVTATAAVAFAAAYMLTRQLWLPVGMHFAWNTCFESVIGLPVSGHPTHAWLRATAEGPAWLSGGTYGIEASAVTLLLWALAAAILLWRARLAQQWRGRA